MTVAFIDVFFLIVIVLFSILVAVKGFVAEFFGKAAFGFALMFAILFFDNLTPITETFISVPVLPAVLSFIIIFSVVYIVLKIFQIITKNVVFSGPVMSGLDRSLGFFLGLIEGIVVCALLCVLMQMQPFIDFSEILGNSLFFAILQPILGLEPIIIPAEKAISIFHNQHNAILYTGMMYV